MTTPFMAQPGGGGPVPLVGVPAAPAPVYPQSVQAQTPLAGFALQNGTPNIVSWTPPADGNVHLVEVVIMIHVTSAETGGGVQFSEVLPDGSSNNASVTAGGSAAGIVAYNTQRLVQGGQPVTISQSSALTAGAAVLWAWIVGS